MDRDIYKQKKCIYNYDWFHVKRGKIGELKQQSSVVLFWTTQV